MENKIPLLCFENIEKEFFGNKVLNDVSFSVNAGEIVGLVGENGAGKSTLMNILFSSSVISSTGGYKGRVLLNGTEVSFKSPVEALEAGIGMVHQEFSLIPGFSAMENIVLNRETLKYNFMVELFGDRMNKLDKSDMRKRAVSAINKLGVGISPETHVSEMSVGQKQFTEIAREIENSETKLLILDEPTAVLTESEAETLINSLRSLAFHGVGIIFISHRLREVVGLCDRIIVLRDGNVIRDIPSKTTDVQQIAEWMVGRQIEGIAARSDLKENRQVSLSIKNLWVDMPGEILKGLSIDVNKGEILGVGGLAGQGKLAISNGIMGIFSSEGDVRFEGKPFRLNDTKYAMEQGFAFVSEDRRGLGLLLEERVHLNIVFAALQSKGWFLKHYLGGTISQLDEDKAIACAKEYIDLLNIRCTGPKQKLIELSGGNQQKVCLAKAFTCKPKVLFVSEPTRGIDIGAKRMVLDALKDYNKHNNTTIVMISSELEELRSICDRIAIVNEGKVAGILSPYAEAKEFGLLMS